MNVNGIVTADLGDIIITIPGARTSSEARRIAAAWLSSVAEQIVNVGSVPDGWSVTVTPVAIPTARVEVTR